MSCTRSLITFLLFFLISISGFSQSIRIGGGLAFSSGVDFNLGSTGNPGLNLKTYHKFGKQFFLKPELTAFNRFNKGDIFYTLNTYMFHFDLDGHYGIVKENKIILYGLLGVNTTTVISRYTQHLNTGANQISDDYALRPGLNIGASLKMHINQSYDGMLQAKYIAGSFNQFVIGLGVIYHPGGNNRGSW